MHGCKCETTTSSVIVASAYLHVIHGRATVFIAACGVHHGYFRLTQAVVRSCITAEKNIRHFDELCLLDDQYLRQ